MTLYPYLPEGRVLKYVPMTNPFMAEAKEAARKSSDQRIPTGAVIVDGDSIVARASNQPPLRSPILINLHKKYCIRRICGIPSGQKYWLCPGCASHANHGEYRAVVELQKHVHPNHGPLDLYLWGHWWCCKPCWDKMLSIGIRDVYLLDGSEILFNEKEKENIIGKQLL